MKKKITHCLFLAFLLLSANSCRLPLKLFATLPVISLGKNGKETTFPLPRILYRKKISNHLNSVHKETLAILEDTQVAPGWKMRQVVVGLGISVEFGISRVMSISAEPSFNLIYRKLRL